MTKLLNENVLSIRQRATRRSCCKSWIMCQCLLSLQLCVAVSAVLFETDCGFERKCRNSCCLSVTTTSNLQLMSPMFPHMYMLNQAACLVTVIHWLVQLSWLDVGQNNITGTAPAWLSNLTQASTLTAVFLVAVLCVGSIAICFSTIRFRLQRNQWQGILCIRAI